MNKAGLLLLLVIMLVYSPAQSQGKHRFDANDLKITWKLNTNNFNQQDINQSTLTLSNAGHRKFPAKGWKIYFNYNRHINPGEITDNVTIDYLNGDFFRLIPAAAFTDLMPGSETSITYLSEGEVLNPAAAPSGLYLVWDDEPDKGVKISNYSLMPIRDTTSGFITPADVFEKNKDVIAIPEKELVKIFPTPASYKEHEGNFMLDAGVSIVSPAEFQKEAAFLADEIGKLTGTKPSVGLLPSKDKSIIFLKEPMADEAYKLVVRPENIEISASSPRGIFYGIQSLRTLISPLPGPGKSPEIEIPAVSVIDNPRFGYRALMLDIARNFQPKAELLKVLDLMALYKLNVLHLHFSDDEGWRIEIPSLPELKDVGSKRGHTTDNRNCLQPSFGSGPEPGILPGSGYYSRADFIEILRYANARHIQVIPEIESPGHGRAAIKAMDARYARYMATGNQSEANKYLLRDINDKSEYSSAQLWSDNIMCVALPSVYNFIEKVVDELAGMYSEAGAPLTSIHMGGDEVPQGVWEQSPVCQKLIDADTSLESTDDLWYYYYRKVKGILKSRNLALMGWEEIAMRKTMLDGHKHYIPNPDFVSDDFRVNVWNNGIGWGSEDLPYRLANAGYKVILSCVSNNYFDLSYERSPEEPGLYWGGIVDIDKPYYFIPFDYYKNTREDVSGKPIDESLFIGKDRLTDYGKSNILGIQGLLWAENLKGSEILEYMLVPKMLSLAERAWAKDPEWAQEPDRQKSGALYSQAWTSFLNVLGQRELPRLEQLNGGYNYRIPSPGAIIRDHKVHVNFQLPGFVIRYTTDGSEPDSSSEQYLQPVEKKGEIRICAFSVSGRKGRTITVVNP